MGQYLQLVLIWMSFSIAFPSESKIKTNLYDLQKVEIEFDVFENVAEIIYNDTMRVKAKVLYMQKKKMVVYKDEKNGRCLLEHIKKHGNVMRIKDFENDKFYSRTYQASGIPVQKVRKIAGKRIVVFCRKLPVILLKEFGEITRHAIENTQRVKRENYYEMRKNESEISHQIPKKLGKRQYPSASAKIVPTSGIDYHARIKNNLQPGVHGMHPIDITSSVTITTGSATPQWSYSSSTGRQHPAFVLYKNGTNTGHTAANSHQFPLPSSFYNMSHISHGPSAHSLVKTLHSPNIHPEGSSYSPVSGQSFQSYHPPSASSKSHVAYHNVTSFGHKSSAVDISQHPIESKFHAPSYYVPSIFSHPATFQPQHGHHQGYFPPSSSSKIHHSILHNQNSSQHESRFSPGRSISVYAPQFFPLETRDTPPHSRVGYEQPHAHKMDTKRTFSHDSSSSAYYPPSSVSHNYHLPHIGGHTVTQPSIQSVTEYPPSSSSKIHPSVSHFSSYGRPAILPTQIPINELHYKTATVAPVGVSQRPSIKGDENISESYPQAHANNIPYSSANVGSTSASLTPLGMGNSQSVYNQPSSEGKIHYLPSNVGRDTHPGKHFPSFPPSSTSKLNYSPIHHVEFPSKRPISHAINHLPPMQYSSTPKTHYIPTTESQSRAQIPQPPSERHTQEQFPPSSTSKTYQFSSHAHTVPEYYPIQHYPPSASSKHQDNRYGVIHEATPQHHADAAYYSPSSANKIQNFSSHPSMSNRHIQSPEFYPLSSTSKVYHAPASASAHDSHIGSRQSLQSKSLTLARDAYYPPSSSSKTLVHSKDSMLHSQANGQTLQYPHYGPSSHHIQKQNSHSQVMPGSVPFSSNGHSIYSSTQYPPTIISKLQPELHHNISGTGQKIAHDYNIKNLHPMLQHSSSSGSQHYWPAINFHNDSSLTGKAHTHNLPSGVYSQEPHSPQYPPSSTSSAHSQRNGQTLTPSGSNSDSAKTQIPCQISPRSAYSITTRTILTPNGIVQRPAAIKTSEESPCGEANTGGSASYNNEHLPCYVSGRYGQTVRDRVPCNVNRSLRNMRKSQRSITAPGSDSLPNMKISHFANGQQDDNHIITTPRSNNQYTEEFANSDGVIITDVAKSQTELVDGISNEELNEKFKLSKLKEIALDTVNSSSQHNEDILPEFSDRNEEMEITEDKKEGSTHSKPVKYNELIDKEKNVDEVEEEVKKGDILQPGDRILGRDGYTILDGFRGRVVSVTGQVGKIRAETTKDNRITKTKSSSNNSNSGQFRYSSELGRYVKDNGNFSSCNGELTFTCTEFLGSNGRAKICKPNPRRNPDGSPC